MIEALQEEKSERALSIEELVESLTVYDQVKDIVQHPGWSVLILALQKNAKQWREECDTLLDRIVLNRDTAKESAFADARIMLRAHEEAIQIWLNIRDKARSAKQILESLPQQSVD